MYKSFEKGKLANGHLQINNLFLRLEGEGAHQNPLPLGTGAVEAVNSVKSIDEQKKEENEGVCHPCTYNH